MCFKGKGGGENTTSANRDVGGCQQEICVRCGGAQSLSIWGSTRAVGVAVVAALAVLGTTVPARALRHLAWLIVIIFESTGCEVVRWWTGSYFLGQLAHLGLCVKHVALGTPKLVWLLQRPPSLSRTIVIVFHGIILSTFLYPDTLLSGWWCRVQGGNPLKRRLYWTCFVGFKAQTFLACMSLF